MKPNYSAKEYSTRRNLKWYNENLMRTLEAAKEKQTREIDKSIRIAEKFNDVMNQQIATAKAVPAREFTPYEDINLMKPVEEHVTDLLMKSTNKGGTEHYLHVRNHKAPEDKFNFRACSSWDYGWQQKSSQVKAREVHRGRCKILKETFYRKNNIGPDPKHYKTPAGANVAFCSEYTCES